MLRIINLPNSHLAVGDLPEDASNFAIHYIAGTAKLVFSSDIQDPLDCGGDMVRLPEGRWGLVGKGDSLFNEQWKEIVPRYDGDPAWIPSYNDPDSGGHGYSYEDFTNKDQRSCLYTAQASGLSWLASLGCTPETTVIIRKIK